MPGRVTPGHLMMYGSRIPPSYSQPLPPRSGRLEVGEPSEVDEPAVVGHEADDRVVVQSQFLQLVEHRPTLVSIVSTIAA